MTRRKPFYHRYRAIYARPPRRWTFMGYGVLFREHEHYFNDGPFLW